MLTRRMNPRVTVSVVFVVAMFMAIMDTTIVNVALPAISRDLSVPLDGVVIGFLVSLAVTIPASGWLGDQTGIPGRPGRRRSPEGGGCGSGCCPATAGEQRGRQ